MMRRRVAFVRIYENDSMGVLGPAETLVRVLTSHRVPRTYVLCKPHYNFGVYIPSTRIGLGCVAVISTLTDRDG